MIDIYSGRIAVHRNGRWYWAQITSGLVAVAHHDRPNNHYALCQRGRYGHIVPNPARYLLVGPELDASDVARVSTEKFGFVESFDELEDA